MAAPLRTNAEGIPVFGVADKSNLPAMHQGKGGKRFALELPPALAEVAAGAFKGCIRLTELNIPESVTKIGEGAFEGCCGLTQLNIPKTVIEIGKGAFKGCSGLTQLNIPESVTKLGEHAFQDCSGLTQLNIPELVTEIRKHAFRNCPSLIGLTLPNADVSMGEGAYDDMVPMGTPTKLYTTNPQALPGLLTFVTLERAGRGRLAAVRGDHPSFEEMCVRHLRPLFEENEFEDDDSDSDNDDEPVTFWVAKPETTHARLQPGLVYRFDEDGSMPHVRLLPHGEDVFEGLSDEATYELFQHFDHLAHRTKPFPWLEQLLKLGPDPRADLCGGRSALELAIHWRLPKAFAWLLGSGYVRLDALSPAHPT